MSLNITVIKDKILSENYFVLRNITYDLTRKNGDVIRHKREVYDRGLSLIHISEPTRLDARSRMPSSA